MKIHYKTNWYGNQGEINSPFVETTESFEKPILNKLKYIVSKYYF